MVLFMNFGLAYKVYLPEYYRSLVGLIGAAALKAVIYFKGRRTQRSIVRRGQLCPGGVHNLKCKELYMDFTGGYAHE